MFSIGCFFALKYLTGYFQNSDSCLTFNVNTSDQSLTRRPPTPSSPKTKQALQFSEDEDAVPMGSLEFLSDYDDECSWVPSGHRSPQGVRGQPDGAQNAAVIMRDTVCVEREGEREGDCMCSVGVRLSNCSLNVKEAPGEGC